MPITLITGPANAGKAQLVMEALRAHLARGDEPLLVVPTRVDAEHYLRELAGEGGGARRARGALRGLIAELIRRAGVREPVLGALAREQLLARPSPRKAARKRHLGSCARSQSCSPSCACAA